MKVVVVYESLFGNTARIAETVAETFRPANDVKVAAAAAIRPADLEAADVVVVGAPTHVHGLPSPRTRAAAIQQGRALPAQVADSGVRELLAELPAVKGRFAAAFDTRIKGPALFTGMPSHTIGARLKRSGYSLLVPAESFFVHGDPAELLPGELERAEAWGKVLVAALPAREPALAG